MAEILILMAGEIWHILKQGCNELSEGRRRLSDLEKKNEKRFEYLCSSAFFSNRQCQGN